MEAARPNHRIAAAGLPHEWRAGGPKEEGLPWTYMAGVDALRSEVRGPEESRACFGDCRHGQARDVPGRGVRGDVPRA